MVLSQKFMACSIHPSWAFPPQACSGPWERAQELQHSSKSTIKLRLARVFSNLVARPNRGGSYETGSDGATDGPPGAHRVPMGPWRARWDAVGSRMGPYINRAPIRDSRATRRAPAGDYMLRAALVVTHFFLCENRHAQKMTHFLVLL